jgi:hypothetical protein
MSAVRELEQSRHLARALGLPFVDLRDYAVSPGILRKLPLRTVVKHRCVPMVYNPRRIVLLVDDAASLAYLAARSRLPGLPGNRPREFALTTPSGLDAAIRRRQELPA